MREFATWQTRLSSAGAEPEKAKGEHWGDHCFAGGVDPKRAKGGLGSSGTVYRSGKSNRSVVEVNAESRQSSKPDKPDVETHRVLMAFAAALTGDSGGNIDTSQRRASAQRWNDCR